MRLPAPPSTDPQRATAALRSRAQILGQDLPPLLAAAEALAASLIAGAHGRRRSGSGEEFWQYRPAQAGDASHQIDWRRSARSEQQFLRQHEWQSPQSVSLWVDDGASMDYQSPDAPDSKAQRARLLALALAALLLRGGERVGLAQAGHAPPKSGQHQLYTLAAQLSSPAPQPRLEHGTPRIDGLRQHGRAVLFSDFFNPLEDVETALALASQRSVRGVLVQILDPMERDFSFEGRMELHSMGGGLRHDSLRASELRAPYLKRLAEQQSHLGTLAQAAGWHVHIHHTDSPPHDALWWLYSALERGRR